MLQSQQELLAAIEGRPPPEAQHMVLMGAGGSGKSRVITLIVEGVRLLWDTYGHIIPVGSTNKTTSQNSVRVAAPTGAASAQLMQCNATTCHSLLGLRVGQSHRARLNPQRLATLQRKLQGLRLLVIDEVRSSPYTVRTLTHTIDIHAFQHDEDPRVSALIKNSVSCNTISRFQWSVSRC